MAVVRVLPIPDLTGDDVELPVETWMDSFILFAFGGGGIGATLALLGSHLESGAPSGLGLGLAVFALVAGLFGAAFEPGRAWHFLRFGTEERSPQLVIAQVADPSAGKRGR